MGRSYVRQLYGSSCLMTNVKSCAHSWKFLWYSARVLSGETLISPKSYMRLRSGSKANLNYSLSRMLSVWKIIKITNSWRKGYWCVIKIMFQFVVSNLKFKVFLGLVHSVYKIWRSVPISIGTNEGDAVTKAFLILQFLWNVTRWCGLTCYQDLAIVILIYSTM